MWIGAGHGVCRAERVSECVVRSGWLRAVRVPLAGRSADIYGSVGRYIRDKYISRAAGYMWMMRATRCAAGRECSGGAEWMSLRSMNHSRGRSVDIYIYARARASGWVEKVCGVRVTRAREISTGVEISCSRYV